MSPSEQNWKMADELCESVWRNRICEDHIPALYLRRQLVDSIAQALTDAREQSVKPFIDAGFALPDGTPRKVLWMDGAMSDPDKTSIMARAYIGGFKSFEEIDALASKEPRNG